jgi:CBS domain-containing protein
MIGEVCTKAVATISSKATVLEAARLMREKNVGALVVVNSQKPKGIITDRDIAVSVVAEGLDPAMVPVGDVMRGHPSVIREDQGIFDAVKLLSAKGVRRLPVVDKHGKLTGIVALDDVLMLLGSEMGHVASALSHELARPLPSV